MPQKLSVQTYDVQRVKLSAVHMLIGNDAGERICVSGSETGKVFRGR